jgi:short-subunit dehydrogenase
VLVNNVGMGAVDPLQKHSLETIFSLNHVNMHSQVFMTMYFLPKFLKKFDEEKTRSAIVNVSSGGAVEPSALRVPYGATKAYNRIFSLGLEKEFKEKIDVLSVLPRNTKSNMNSGRNFFTITS